MILPTKHITTEQSLIGLGALLLSHLTRPKTISALWNKVSNNKMLATYERFILTLDLLYSIEAIELSQGLLRRCDK